MRCRSVLAVCTFVLFLSAMAMANGLNLNGLGARAVAMGGAFVGLADDYSAIFWNPAGIALIKQKTFGFSADDIIPSGTYKFDFPHPLLGPITLVDAKMTTTHNFTGLAAYYHPINDKLVFGFGFYTPSGLASKWDGTDFSAISFNTPYEWKSKIFVINISPAIGYQVSDQVSVGATLNINYGKFQISTHAGDSTLGIDLGQQDMDMSGWGFGATFGILIRPSEKFSLGATFRTPSKIKFSGDTSISKLSILGQIPGTPLFGASIPTETAVDGEVTYPMWLCGGVAFKPVEGLTLTADVQYTNWKKIDVIEFELENPLWQAIVGEPGTGNLEMALHWKNATQVRFGAEYKINKVALRGGYYFDPTPSPDSTHNVLVPNYDFNAFAFGFGYNLNGFHIDFMFEYRKAKERTISLLEEEAMPGVYNLSLFVPGFSLGYSW